MVNSLRNWQYVTPTALRRQDGFAEFRQRFAECSGPLFANIAALHNVDVETVSQAALERNGMADFILVYLPMAILFVLFVYRQCGRIFLRTDSIIATMILACVTSILASGCGVLVGEMWALAVETLRIGNGHLSFRTARIPWSSEREYLLAVGLVLFWVIAALQYRQRRNSPIVAHHAVGSQLGLK
jgi:hypothetical protein